MEKENKNQNLWQGFADRNQLSANMVEKFKKYYNLMQNFNKFHNITAIENLEDIIEDHFEDSLALSDFISKFENSINCLADVGSGGGFPGIPLKIKFDQLKVILIEVSGKKLNFLESVIKELDLKGIETCSLDWRTFLRNTDFNIDLFCARASLSPNELIRALRPGCFYNNSTVIYWASQYWQPDKQELNFINETYSYNLSSKSRNLIFFKNSNYKKC